LIVHNTYIYGFSLEIELLKPSSPDSSVILLVGWWHDRKIRETVALDSHILEILPPVLHHLPLRPLVVVRIEDILALGRSILNGSFRNVLVQVVCDTAAT
jgi:hypothetical protein